METNLVEIVTAIIRACLLKKRYAPKISYLFSGGYDLNWKDMFECILTHDCLILNRPDRQSIHPQTVVVKIKIDSNTPDIPMIIEKIMNFYEHSLWE